MPLHVVDTCAVAAGLAPTNAAVQSDHWRESGEGLLAKACRRRRCSGSLRAAWPGSAASMTSCANRSASRTAKPMCTHGGTRAARLAFAGNTGMVVRSSPSQGLRVPDAPV